MTLIQAAQSAIDVQNACNASGVVRALGTEVMDALWEHAHANALGTPWVNSSPIIAMYLFKLGELNGCGISSLDGGYAVAERACLDIIAKG